MAKEKEVLLEMLQDYYIVHNTNIIPQFYQEQKNIKITGIENKAYTLEVIQNNTNYTCSVTIAQESIEISCTCNKATTCIHVGLSYVYLLGKACFMSLENIAAAIGDFNKFTGKYEAYLSKKIKNMLVSHIIDDDSIDKQNTPYMPKTINWKSFHTPPSAVFQSVYNNFMGVPTALQLKKTFLKNFDEAEVTCIFEYQHDKKNIFTPQIRYDRADCFYYTCNCSEAGKMCSHVKASFEQLARLNGRNFFLPYKDTSAERNVLLKPYGLTVADPEAADFIFQTDYWGNFSVVAPAWLWKDNVAEGVKKLKNILTQVHTENNGRPLAHNAIIDFEIGFLFNLSSKHFKIDFELEVVKVINADKKPGYAKLRIHDDDNLLLLKELPDELYNKVILLTDRNVKSHLAQKGHSYLLYNSMSNWNSLSESSIADLRKHYLDTIIKMWPLLCLQKHIVILRKGSFSNANIQPIALSPDFLTFSFKVEEEQRYMKITLQKEINDEVLPDDKVALYGGFIFEVGNKLYLPSHIADIDMLGQFRLGFIRIPIASKEEIIRNLVPLLERRYKVYLPPALATEKIEAEMKPQVLLKEQEGKYLVIMPQYIYNDTVVNYEPSPDNILKLMPDGRYVTMVREAENEQAFFAIIRLLHPKFAKQSNENFFFLTFDETMVKNWFIETIRHLLDNGINVVGMQELKKHRYNANKPVWEMSAGSGIDWFDLQIKVTFGDQVVELRSLRKSLLTGQNIVMLGDGTFGVLPEEWLKQYGMLLKMGDEQKDGSLRVNKLHYTLIDELHAQIDNEDIIREINEKKQRLLNIGDIKTVKPSKDIKATLRPYQLSGFQWLQTLDELGWGGCLADDMGLGKTLQTITFLQYLKTKYKKSTHLVICPTSLIYNWENELKKFAPTLKYHIYYGLERQFSDEHFNDYNVIITSYGIMRNDLEELMKFDWHYIILDESQAIKNPDAQTNKALQLLKSKNRLILSGTPIQNNTFDIFAQFQFINPGLLGNKDFFKSEFANPIDKNNDTVKSEQLRRLIYPFMLRRTKEQVATDLPDKTETILWCEMSRDQRAVYNDYKNHYRTTLMKKIEEVGMAKAGMYVLEGLLRLRQICDSPTLVKDADVTTTKSIKIDELMREIEENAGGHKLLVFSQFTEMLHLIERELQKEKVSYSYLDGSIPAEKRKAAVDKFQDDPTIRVFLISLKAGGVGLNLTAADYVYIVDPWWNPAVEQQAIDRTHRIGQVNKIFAYKMICKDTVEEKIVQLQQKKKQLANDLVTEDAGFIKKMTKDDVAFLFS